MAKKKTAESIAYNAYLERTGNDPCPITTALIDMDGALFDSMPNHAKAWSKLSTELGINHDPDEFYLYEGMTGAATIRLLMKRELGREDISDEECKELYAKKAQYFIEQGEVSPMEGAEAMLTTLRSAAIKRVLVTGSGLHSLLDRLDKEYPGAFTPELMVTAHDVKYGKPNPEPYLMGLKKAKVDVAHAIVIENAPLGVKAGHESGCFTVGITTGPIPKDVLIENGADIVYPTMTDFIDGLFRLIQARNFSF